MFLPLDKKPDWHHPPVITLILVLANILLFYTWQSNDEQYDREAFEYYIDSGLIQTELKAYLADKGQSERLSKQDLEHGTHTAMDVYDEMRRDGEFQHRLEQGKVIQPGDIGYADWQTKHKHFARLKQRVVSEQFGLNPSKPSALTFLTNLFLHGNSGHLLGNMVMLLLLGFGVEIILGRWLFLIGYFISGIAAGLAYVLLYSSETIATIGASGALSSSASASKIRQY